MVWKIDYFSNSIVGIATSSGGMRSSLSDIALFTIMVLVFATGQYVILRFVKSRYLDRENETAITRSHVHWIDRITTFAQYALVVILASVIFQIAVVSSHHIYSVILAIFISVWIINFALIPTGQTLLFMVQA